MATSFESLIAVAKAQKEQKDKGLEAVKLDKERREREKLRKQQEDERKERELAAKMRQRHFEAQKREEEQKRKREAQEKAAEAARQKQQQEERDALIYGPKRAKSAGPGWPSKRQRTSDDEQGEAPGGNFLTREEKRERQKAAMFRSSSSIKRSSQAGKGYGKAGRTLPGGAVNVLATSSSSGSGSGSGSVKERLMHAPNQLIKLNTVKRDMRTIDEIVSDLHQKKTLSGDQAKSFDDWFGDNKKKASTPVKKASPQPTSSSTATKKSTPVPPSRPPSAPRTTSKPSKPAPTVPKKRPRSLSPAPPPRKSSGGGGGSSAIRSMVWEAMNFNNKGRPSAEEVYSDDEDMEADAFSVVEEEEISARIARREEAAALAEERRHEEEKRRRKMARQ